VAPKAGLEDLENISVLIVPGIELRFLGRPLCCLVTILAPVEDGIIWKGLRAGDRSFIFKEVTGYLFIINIKCVLFNSRTKRQK
jgi:hypothetical protein